MTALLAITRAHKIKEQPPERKWLIENLWLAESVGIIGGEPKCCKSFLMLAMAVAIASGKLCLNRFSVPKKGRVMIYAAEDGLHIVRARLDAISQLMGVKLKDLEIHVVTEETVRIDLPADRAKLIATIRKIKPVFLGLDPFVRLHRIDENRSGEVAPLLAFLRELNRNRKLKLSIALVHHMSKGGKNKRSGQRLRGSSEFHAWGDSNLYMSRHKGKLYLTIEHRNAPSVDALELMLQTVGLEAALVPAEMTLDQDELPLAPTLREKMTVHLQGAKAPMSSNTLQKLLGIRKATVVATMKQGVREKWLKRQGRGVVLVRSGSKRKPRTLPEPEPEPED